MLPQCRIKADGGNQEQVQSTCSPIIERGPEKQHEPAVAAHHCSLKRGLPGITAKGQARCYSSTTTSTPQLIPTYMALSEIVLTHSPYN